MVSALRPITRGRPRGPLPAPSTSSRVIARAPFRRDAARHNRPGRLASPSAASADSLDYRELLDCGTYEWQGYKIRSAVSKSRKPGSLNVLLVHGFGASIGHFKKNIVALVDEGHSVHAIDLLGFGESEKPLDYSYSMEGWRDLLVSYVKDEIVGRSGEGEAKVVIAGNSIGSLASLMAARALVEDSLRDSLAGVVLFNCAGGMNNAATLDDDWRIRLAYPIFALINALLKIEPVAKFLFGKFSTKENIEGVLRQVYMNQDAVDEDLVDLIHEPSTKPGALEAFVSILTGPPGPRPEKHVPTLVAAEVPIFVLWGTTDPFTPIDGPVAKFFLDELEPAHDFVTKAVVDDVGHCPHDDRPEVVHEALMPWLSRL